VQASWQRSAAGRGLLVANRGGVPALAVHFDAPEASDSLRLADSFLWLNPGEERLVPAEWMPNIDGRTPARPALKVLAWNAEPQAVTGTPP